MIDRALVLAGGGLAGIAWEVGVLVGIRDGWPALEVALLDDATLFVGTSAGSAVASQVAAGVPLDALFEAQLAEETAELGAELDPVEFSTRMQELAAGATSPAELRRRIGAFAVAASTGDAAARTAAIRSRLIADQWTDRQLRIAAVDADRGDLVVFDRDSGVPLIDAVAASCAVPGVFPVVPIDGRRYTDGGVRSATNADLAAGAARVLVLTPGIDGVPDAELAALGTATTRVVPADDEALAAFGANPLDPAVRPGAARAGREQGRRIATDIAESWG